MIKPKNKSLYLAVTLASSGLAPGHGFAQNVATLEEVIVTATKREENINTVPVSITALGGDALELQRFQTIADFQVSVPNLNITKSSSTGPDPIISIRGIFSRDPDATTDNAVGMYMDDVYLSRGYSVLGQMLDVDRVEVLRGPQGTLFGRNTVGGAVHIVSRTPEIGGEIEGRLVLTAGNYDLMQGVFTSNLPLGETTALRVAGMITKRDGYTESWLVDEIYVDGVTPGKKIDSDDQDDQTYRLSFAWEPAAATLLNVSAYHSESDTNGRFMTGARGDVARNVDGKSQGVEKSVFRGNDFYSGITSVAPETDSEIDVYIGNLTHEFDNGVGAKLIVSYAETETSSVTHQDGWVAAEPLLFGFWVDGGGESEQATAELQFSGSADSLDWIAGAYYFEEESTDTNRQVITSLIPFLNDTNLIDVTAENDSWSLYGSGVWNMSESFALRFGGRYTEDTKGFDGRTTTASGICVYTGLPVDQTGCRLEDEVDFDNITWDISLDYNLSDSIFMYAKVATGYRTGGISLRATTPELAEPFDEEEAISYEAGIKADIGSNAHVNFTAFLAQYTDLQQSTISTDAVEIGCVTESPITPTPITCNVGDLDAQGFEADAIWHITDSFQVTANLGYVDMEFDDDSDRHRIFTPEWTYEIAARYDADVFDTPFSAFISYQESADWYASGNPEFDDISKQAGYQLLNARLSLQLTDAISISLWGKNLTEDEYIAAASITDFPVGFFDAGSPGAPRTYGADFRWDF